MYSYIIGTKLFILLNYSQFFTQLNTITSALKFSN